MSANREAVVETSTLWTREKGGSDPNITSSVAPTSTKPESKKDLQRTPFGDIALAASIAFTAFVLPNATDRSSLSVRNYFKPSHNFRCERNCTSSSFDDEISKQTLHSLERELETLFNNAKNEIIEGNHESNFANELHSLLVQFGTPILTLLGDLVSNPSIDVEAASQALRVIGRTQDELTVVPRFRLLIKALNSPSPIIRDSTALALFDLNEPGAIPYLQEAAAREEYVSLRNDYLQIAEELEAA
ncbi:MAG: hypothetical protein Tsb0026_00140 [Sulfuricaulis sp.]